jgi:hypothetical protein
VLRAVYRRLLPKGHIDAGNWPKWSLIMAPLKPRWTMTRSSSVVAAFTSCIGNVASPAKRSGQVLVVWPISSLESLEVAMATPVSRG